MNDDIELLRGLNGVHFSLLDPPEIEAFERLRLAGLAVREYSGTAGALGLSTMRLFPAAGDEQPKGGLPCLTNNTAASEADTFSMAL